jgi:two-component system, OmpR family, sensor kinase
MKLPARFGGLRVRLLAAVVAAVAATLLVLTVAFNVVVEHRVSHEIKAILHARAAAALDTVGIEHGRLTAADRSQSDALDSGVWVFAGTRPLRRREASPAVQRAAQALASGPGRRAGIEHPATSLLSVPVVHSGRRLGTVVVAVSLEGYRRTQRIALVASLLLAVLVLGAVTMVSRWVLGAALEPVTRMTRDAAHWSELDLDRRFDLGPPTDELTELAATLDGLLGRLAAAVRHEQRLSSELSHELRTPLAKIATRSQLLAGDPDLPDGARAEVAAITRTARQMGATLETLMTAARAESGQGRGVADVGAAARAALDGCTALAASRSVSLQLDAPSAGLRVSAEPALVERMLAPVLENACRFAHRSAEVRVERANATVHILVADDGPGIAPSEEAAIFEPGHRGTAADGDAAHAGSGLGLSLARRLARSAGGDIEARCDPQGGRFVIRLPEAHTPTRSATTSVRPRQQS